MSPDFLPAFLAAGLAAGMPIALAAIGGLFTEAAGSLSVALEGGMIVGAFAAAVASASGGGLALALPAAALAGLLLSLLVGLASARLKADVFVAGLAANLLAPGLVSVFSERLFGTKGVIPAAASGASGISLLADLPLIGPALFGQDPSFYALALTALLLSLAFSLSPFGLRIRAAGDQGEAAPAAGIDREGQRLAAHLVAGLASGLAGASLSLRVAAFVPGMSAGRGWIALVAIYLGGRRPLGTALASLGFGLLIALSNAVQAFESAPAELFLALPYLITALALVFGKAIGAHGIRGVARGVASGVAKGGASGGASGVAPPSRPRRGRADADAREP